MDVLPGQITFLLVVAALDAAVLGWLTLRWYQRTVIRLMRQHDSERAPADLNEPAASGVARPGHQSGAAPGGRADDSYGPRLVRRVAGAYVIGALLFSLVISAGVTVVMGTGNPAIVATWVWAFAWPIVPSLGLLLAFDARRTLVLTAGYLAAGALAVAAATVVSQALAGAIDAAPLTNIHAAVRTMVRTVDTGVVLVALTAWRRGRLVMPLALAVSLTFGLALVITPPLVMPAFDIPAIRDAVLAVPFAVGRPLYYAVVLLVALPLGWIAWRLLNRLAAAFSGKRFSDAQLIVDCWWAIVAVETSATFLVGPFGPGGLAIGAGAFLAYRSAVAVALRAAGVGRRHGAGRLLLLRVFGYQARTEALFDAIAQRWRLRGPVHLIGAADLATRTTDPGDILAFVDGRLGEQFVTRPTDIPRRVASLDTSADPDGRFRVNEIYCHDGVWRETLVDLLRVTDVVVMDLRQFSRANRGCIFEIEQLFTRLPPERIVLIGDASTDRALLREVIAAAWPGVAGDAAATGEGSIVSVDGNSRRELDDVMRRMVQATARPVPA